MTIEWTTRAARDLRRLAPRDRDRLMLKVEQYAREPASLANQVTRLTGSEDLRLRVGDHRVIFRVEGRVAVVMVVLRVRHGREAYDRR